MSDELTNDTDEGPRQHDAVTTLVKSREWSNLLALRSTDQPVTAVLVLIFALGFGGWYVWRLTTSPNLIELDQTEPVSSKLVVNVNTAAAAELMLLPEIGPRLSDLIITERQDHGPFRNAEDFRVRVRGIGPKTLPKLVPYLEGWTNVPKSK